MKAITYTISLLISLSTFSQKDLELNLTGLPDYRKLLTPYRAFPIYKKDDEKVFYMTPIDYFSFGGMTDTLEFTVSGDSSNYNIDLKNKIKGLTVQLEHNVLSLILGENSMEYDIKISRSMKNIVYQPIMKGIFTEDEELGKVITQNRLTRYAHVNLNNETFNIAILDKNKNGTVDKNDLLSLSFDAYFMTRENLTCTFLKKKSIIKVGDYFYNILWDKGYKLKIEPVSNQSIPDITLSKLIPDIIIRKDTLMSDLVKNNEYTIISIWSVYCPPCIGAIKDLNKLNNVIGIHLDEKIDLSKLEINYLDFTVSQKQLNNFNINGYPNYIVVNKKLEALARYRSLSEIPDKFKYK